MELVSAETILPFVRQAIQDSETRLNVNGSGSSNGIQNLAVQVAGRNGTDPESEEKVISRLLADPEKKIRFSTFERLCVTFNLTALWVMGYDAYMKVMSSDLPEDAPEVCREGLHTADDHKKRGGAWVCIPCRRLKRSTAGYRGVVSPVAALEAVIDI